MFNSVKSFKVLYLRAPLLSAYIVCVSLDFLQVIHILFILLFLIEFWTSFMKSCKENQRPLS